MLLHQCSFINIIVQNFQKKMIMNKIEKVARLKRNQHTLKVVRKRCANEELRLTPTRLRVLEILLESSSALGAYQILDRLRLEGRGSQPPVAYRALDFLVQNGFAHKIERLNAFVACNHPDEKHVPAFFICRSCELVAESCTTEPNAQLGRVAAESGFVIERSVVEVEGVCQECRSNAL